MRIFLEIICLAVLSMGVYFTGLRNGRAVQNTTTTTDTLVMRDTVVVIDTLIETKYSVINDIVRETVFLDNTGSVRDMEFKFEAARLRQKWLVTNSADSLLSMDLESEMKTINIYDTVFIRKETTRTINRSGLITGATFYMIPEKAYSVELGWSFSNGISTSASLFLNHRRDAYLGVSLKKVW